MPSSLSPSPATATPPLTFGTFWQALRHWATRSPVQAVLGATLLGTFIYFYFVSPLYYTGTKSVMVWAKSSWNEVNNSEHGILVPFIFLGLIWYHRDRLRAAPKQGSIAGLWVVVLAVAIFIGAAWSLQPRLALFALPFLFTGTFWFLWGWPVARLLLFACAFLVFMITTGFVEQATFNLQFIITGVVGAICNLLGIHIRALGTTLAAADNSFRFEIIGGCSGIRSLFAMAMLTAVYVHLFQRLLWKKIVIFAASLLFAVIGNIGRVLTIILVARFIGDEAAEYAHDYSGFIFFPIALSAMIGFSKLLNFGQPERAVHATPTVSLHQSQPKMTKRLGLLQLLLLGGFSLVFTLPTKVDEQPSGARLNLPEFLGEWYGTPITISAREQEVLGADTDILRKSYTNGRGDELYVTIVLSGRDMNNSVHRPERCLPAQGWTLIDSKWLKVPFPGTPPHTLPVTRLHVFQPARLPSEELIRDARGDPISIYNLNYYWFIGYRQVCATHAERLFIDLRDRLFRGRTQRWAYVTVAASITKGRVPFGKDEAATDAVIQTFIRQLAPQIIEPSVKLP